MQCIRPIVKRETIPAYTKQGYESIVTNEYIELPESFIQEHQAFLTEPAHEDDIKPIMFKVAGHKRIDGGESRIHFIVNDTAEELAALDVTMFSVYRAFRDIKLDKSPFFPHIGEIVEQVMRYQRIKIVPTGTFGRKSARRKAEPPAHVKTDETKRNVSEICKEIYKQTAKGI